MKRKKKSFNPTLRQDDGTYTRETTVHGWEIEAWDGITLIVHRPLNGWDEGWTSSDPVWGAAVTSWPEPTIDKAIEQALDKIERHGLNPDTFHEFTKKNYEDATK